MLPGGDPGYARNAALPAASPPPVPSRPLVAVEARSAQHGAAGHQAAVTECS